MTKIKPEVLDTKHRRARLDEARKNFDACTTREKLGVLHRLSFECDQIYKLNATRLYDQGWGKNKDSLTR